MATTPKRSTLLGDFEGVELRPGLHCIDVLGDVVQEHSNSEWRRLGEAFARHLAITQQSAVLVSTYSLEHYLVTAADRPNTDNSASFEHEGMHYVVTSLNPTSLEHTLPDIVESEEFIFGLNAWLCFFDNTETSNAQTLCQSASDGGDTTFVREMKRLISTLSLIVQAELSLELIAAISDGCELLWFNPKI